MVIQRLLTTGVGAVILAGALIASPARAVEDETRAQDRAAVAACLDLVAQAAKRQTEALNKAQAEDHGAPKAEKIDPAAWLRHAGERAGGDEASCIGVISTPCQDTQEGRSTAGSTECIERELAVWDERLNKSYKRWMDTCGEANVCAARKKFARAWLAARDARCALPWIEMQGTMANPLTASCKLDVTAHQAIWLDGDAQ